MYTTALIGEVPWFLAEVSSCIRPAVPHASYVIGICRSSRRLLAQAGEVAECLCSWRHQVSGARFTGAIPCEARLFIREVASYTS